MSNSFAKPLAVARYWVAWFISMLRHFNLPSGHLLPSYWTWPTKVNFPIKKYQKLWLSVVMLFFGNTSMGISGSLPISSMVLAYWLTFTVPHKWPSFVGKYTIHGAYGLDLEVLNRTIFLAIFCGDMWCVPSIQVPEMAIEHLTYLYIRSMWYTQKHIWGKSLNMGLNAIVHTYEYMSGGTCIDMGILYMFIICIPTFDTQWNIPNDWGAISADTLNFIANFHALIACDLFVVLRSLRHRTGQNFQRTWQCATVKLQPEIPSGNQTWQWKRCTIYRWFFLLKPFISSGFPIATFDCRRQPFQKKKGPVFGMTPRLWGDLWCMTWQGPVLILTCTILHQDFKLASCCIEGPRWRWWWWWWW